MKQCPRCAALLLAGRDGPECYRCGWEGSTLSPADLAELGIMDATTYANRAPTSARVRRRGPSHKGVRL